VWLAEFFNDRPTFLGSARAHLILVIRPSDLEPHQYGFDTEMLGTSGVAPRMRAKEPADIWSEKSVPKLFEPSFLGSCDRRRFGTMPQTELGQASGG